MSGNFVPTGPFVNNSAPGISASALNNIENVFYRRSGDNENGKYYIVAAAFATSAAFGQWIGLTSRSTPSSVAIDTSIVLAGYGAPITFGLDKSGFDIQASATGVSNTSRYGGVWTVSY
jgi:hypothetical protein